MKRTPQYRFAFYQGGDIYRASDDLDRMTVIDNQLVDLSGIVGDGVLGGWTISQDGSSCGIEVMPGQGIIDNIITKTLSIKSKTITSDVLYNVYMQSTMIPLSGSLNLETEGPPSNMSSDVYQDLVPPSVPTGLAAASPEFDLVNLTWNANPNTEINFSHYEVWRDGVLIASPTTNGILGNPYQDTGLTASTTYTYTLRAVSKSGVPSAYTTGVPILTPPDLTVPAEPGGLVVYAGDTTISVVWNQSATVGSTYRVAVQALALDGTPGTPTIFNTSNIYLQVTGLTNGVRYRVTLQAVGPNIVPSAGTTADATPSTFASPLDPLLSPTAVVPGVKSVVLNWLASPSPVGGAASQMQEYRVRVVLNGVESDPIKGIGTALTKTIVSYRDKSVASLGQVHLLQENVLYTFRITAIDAFNNESAGLYVRGSILDTTPPKDPRYLQLVPGDTTIAMVWKHSSSPDVAGYVINIDAGAGYGPDIDIAYLEQYVLTSLTNGVLTKVRLRSKDTSGNLSAGNTFGSTTPVLDTTPPAVPTGLNAVGLDQHSTISWIPNQEPDLARYFVKRMSTLQNLLAIPGKPLTEALDTGLVFAVGPIDRVDSSTEVWVSSFHGLPDQSDRMFVVTNGSATGQRAIIATFDSATGHMTLKTPLAVLPKIGSTASINFTHPSLGTFEVDVGLQTNILDIGLLNGQTYAYWVRAVDTRGNTSDYSPFVLVAPTCGNNDLPAPTGLVATFVAGPKITLTWNALAPDADHPGPYTFTAYNIYRSTNQYGGFTLIDSVGPTILTYDDTDLINGTTYYYIVTAVRDNAELLLDSGSVQPGNTVLLGQVQFDTGTCEVTFLQNQQRIVESLQASIQEDAARRLLAHHHSAKATNSTTVTAVSSLIAIDLSTLSKLDFTTVTQNVATAAYYQSLLKNQATGDAITYDANTTYAISPDAVVGNLPYVGDFQVLVNGVKPTQEFTIDEDRNVIVFTTALVSGSVVSCDGGGFSYYVPAMIDLGYIGFDVQVNGASSTPVVDESLQTVRFVSPLLTTDVVTVIVEPVVPTIEVAEDKVAQINLSPNLVLSDFTTQNGTLFVSASGIFSSSDVFYVLVDGVKTTLPHAVDTTNKTITFSQAIPSTSTVSLEILNREEVQNYLPASRIIGLDASQFTKGTFLKAQLPALSHEGRVQEQAFPLFQTLTGTDRYNYAAETGILGSATTPYAVYQFPSDGSLLLGTSAGLLRSTGFAAFLSEDEGSETVIDYTTQPPSGLTFQTAQPDQIVGFARAAVEHSGRFTGTITIILSVDGVPTPTVEIYNPNLTLMDDGKVLISGGATFNKFTAAYYTTTNTYVYDPALGYMKQVGSLYNKRWGHATLLLPGGKVLASGGSYDVIVHMDQTTFTPDAVDTIRISTAEIYDNAFGIWMPAQDMLTTRDYHSCVLLDDDTVLIAGGNTGVSSFNGLYNPPRFHQPDVLDSAEKYSVGANLWTTTGAMNKARTNATAATSRTSAIVTGGGQAGQELYTLSSGTWIMEGTQAEITQNLVADAVGPNSIDSPVKQFLQDSLGGVLLVSGNKVYSTADGASYVKMKGLEAAKTVHRIAQGPNGTLYAATDLGVYEITPDIHDQMTWFQGGIIGAGTTETFDLEPYGSEILAGTEIGIFSTIDNGDNWTQLVELTDVYNVKAAGTVVFANAGQDLYRGDPGYGPGNLVWTKVGTYDFIDVDSKLVVRAPFDMFFTTPYGLYASRDGTVFFQVDFDKNRHSVENNVSMAVVVGSDLLVGYDNNIIAVGPNFETLLLAQFPGIVPTITVNDVEQRIGFRYDTVHNMVVFEQKRFASDVIKASSNYGVYEMQYGQWYRNNPSAAVTVFVNGKRTETGVTLNPMLGWLTFAENLTKIDVVRATIVGTTLKGEGEHFHSEIEDRMEQEKGLPLSMGNDHAGNILQMGLSVEHNFWERGIDRNQYYCYIEGTADRSFTSFLSNAEFYIMGRREFDRFNSTIDYSPESEQTLIGKRSLVPLSTLEVSPNLWVGTENGIFVLDATTSAMPITATLEPGGADNDIRDMQYFLGDIWTITQNGIYIRYVIPPASILPPPATGSFVRNAGNGLPGMLYCMGSISSLPFIGTGDGIYYSDGSLEPVPFSTWYKGLFVENVTQAELTVSDPCSAIAVGDSIAYASIDRGIYVSVDGKTWTHVYTFNDTFSLFSLAFFAKKLYVGTNQGVYCDDGSCRSSSPAFTLQKTDGNLVDSATLSVNQVYASGTDTGSALYAVGSKGNVYCLSNEIWTATPILGAVSIQRFIVVNGTRQVALANDTVYVQ